MLFNSPQFFVFLIVVYLLYRILPFRWQNWLLIVAGYIFYGFWDVRFLFLIACSTTVDFCIGLLLANAPPSAPALYSIVLFNWSCDPIFMSRLVGFELSTSLDENIPALLNPQPIGLKGTGRTVIFVLVTNLLISTFQRFQKNAVANTCFLFRLRESFVLRLFKYFNFFIDSAAMPLRVINVDPTNFRLGVVLPVGISFYTFQSLSYTIDVYRRRVAPTSHFWDFALFVAYFPPLVAGPIERGPTFVATTNKSTIIHLGQSMDGIVLIFLGLFKKVAIADGVAPAVDSVFNSTGAVSE